MQPTGDNPSIRIVDAHAPPLIDAARAIFAEYGKSIENVAACSLRHQGFSDELAGLPGLYAPPPRGRGCMLLAFDGGTALQSRDVEPIGCIALRPAPGLPDHVCEMKRMYVREAARGRGVGRLLAEALLDRARRLGYREMVLDTATIMTPAIALYRSLGFVERERYNSDPDPETLWFMKGL